MSSDQLIAWTFIVSFGTLVATLTIGYKIMSALDDVTAAVNRLITDVKAIATKLTTTPPDDSAALEALAGQLNDAATAAETALGQTPAASPATESPASA